jgi:hypothetical protein
MPAHAPFPPSHLLLYTANGRRRAPAMANTRCGRRYFRLSSNAPRSGDVPWGTGVPS